MSYAICPNCGDRHPKGAIYCKKPPSVSKEDLQKIVKVESDEVTALRAEVARLKAKMEARRVYMREYMKNRRKS